ncbi:DUF3048 domain-containing protein [Paenibacillus marinisediminis]
MNRAYFLRSKWILLVMICLTLLNACGSSHEPVDVTKPADTPQETTVPQPEPQLEPEPVEPDPTVRAPFTGLAWKEGEEEKANQRPIAVMVNNDRKARPQSGLPAADVLIEVLAEGGITRIVAVYHSQLDYAGEIGPVRSIRPYLIELGESYGAMLVHAGASNDGYYILQRQHKEHLDEISNAGVFFWRDHSRKAPHNLYTNLDKLKQGMKKKGYAETIDIPAMAIQQTSGSSVNPPFTKETATNIDITFLKNSYPVAYQYDAGRGNYIRYMDEKPHIDKVTEQALRTDNILVVEAEHKVLDDVGRLEVDLNLQGEAVWFYKGEAVRGKWVRSGKGPIQFTVADQIVELGAGVTHIMIVPTTGGLNSHVKW